MLFVRDTFLCKGRLVKIMTFPKQFMKVTSFDASSLNFMVSLRDHTVCMLQFELRKWTLTQNLLYLSPTRRSLTITVSYASWVTVYCAFSSRFMTRLFIKHNPFRSFRGDIRRGSDGKRFPRGKSNRRTITRFGFCGAAVAISRPPPFLFVGFLCYQLWLL